MLCTLVEGSSCTRSHPNTPDEGPWSHPVGTPEKGALCVAPACPHAPKGSYLG